MARIQTIIRGADVMLVNDSPVEMTNMIEIMRDLGLKVHVEKSSEEALTVLSRDTFHVVISDMERDGVDDEGTRFLKKMRDKHVNVPVIFTVGRFDRERGTPPFAFGITNRVDECLNLLFDVLERACG